MSSYADPDSPIYERLQKVNKTLNQELLHAEEGSIEKSPNPFDKLKSVNKSQHQEYLKYAAERDRNKQRAAALFAYGPRFMQVVVIIIVIFASCAYIGVLGKL